MRNSISVLRFAPTLAAAAVLPAALAAPSAAVSGISVSTTGSSVSVVTSACTQINGSWGTAALLTSNQANFAQGRQVALSGTTISQSAGWSKVSPGTYTVVVVCSSGSTAGSQSVIVSAGSTPTLAATSRPGRTTTTTSPAPNRGVNGGLGGTARDYGPLTLGLGAALVGAGVVTTGWCLRRRTEPYRS
ncbi:hypothetical protein [Streptomyces malaysiense]|uniref:Secreted protein n=1 Tax=Streptomyces malaysiense TaxID=1428626 RepID=A0A1J4Q0N8_9ACTN|nr:hypothetical protein [Streptomyces malaysiense]OIK26132.1 hypothetical protein VT52_017830 [Streptomyces malaysiense]